ncbi:MAG: isocitrate/isopropylmalate dehydrogenase family protein [Candidatus Stahlbacteria bacterium]|nr:MAG: isocitrate/isopropylmalate dehydrogenase family protein [Candidatus Stahlbacteria bacterium]
MARKIVTLPGDGIGKIVLPEAIRVLNAVGFKAEYIEGDVGWKFWVKEGNPLPERTINLLEEYRVALFGAITSKPKDVATDELSPELQDRGLVYYSPIVKLRQHFKLDICIRPCKSFKGNPLNFIRRTADGFEEPEIDVVIFRQNTEGLYSGVEWTNPPSEVRKALETHTKMEAYSDVKSEDLAISVRIFSRPACRRIIREAFEYAKKFGYKSVTVAEKPNVIRETSGMMREEAKKMREDYPDVDLYFTNIDAQMMWMTKNPEDYDVIVAGNMFGDIVSDGFAGLTGGLGFARSANIGKDCAIFEPTHGSAPKYEKLKPSIVSPFAMILSASMMLDYLEEYDEAIAIRNAIARVVTEGEVRSYDMLKLKGGGEVLSQGAASTSEITDAIIESL